MDKSEIDLYLSNEFWEDSDVVTLGEGGLNMADVLLPNGGVLFQTSGSSGGKKWVVHTRESLLESARMVTEHLEVRVEDRWFLALPIEHVGGFGVLARCFYSGCGVVHFEGKWNASEAVRVMDSERVSLCSFVPTQVVDVVLGGLVCPASVRGVIVGGGRLDGDMKRRAERLGWPILESYGMTETGSQIATQMSTEEDGMALIKGWEVRVGDNQCLEVRGGGLMKGYLVYEDDDFVLSEPFDDDGWFRTSDRVEILSDSERIRFISRSDRMVKILGELVCLDSVEFELRNRVNVEVLIVEVADERRGYFLHAVIESSGASEVDLELLRMSGLHRLEGVIRCDCFPRNEMGKIDRVRLRELVVISGQDV